MEQAEALSAVIQIAEEVFEVQPPVAVPHAHLVDDLGATSVTRLEFLVALERRFDVQLDHQEVERADTLDQVASVLRRRLSP